MMKKYFIYIKLYLTLAILLTCGDLFAQTISQTFTPASATTFTVPAGITRVQVEAWGGGGKGGNRTTNGVSGGGGGGAYAKKSVTVSGETTYNLQVGTGSTSNTTSGGDSWFLNPTTVFAKGGSSVSNNNATGVAGGAFATSIGEAGFVFAGGKGSNGLANSYGGGGGSSAGSVQVGTTATNATGATSPTGGGNGGNGRSSTEGEGSNGEIPGGGGGGGYRTSTVVATRAGGNGGDGQLIISYTYLDIKIKGNSVIIPSGKTTTSEDDNTDFGTSEIILNPLIRTFAIENFGENNLILSGSPKVTISGSSDFTVLTYPSSPVPGYSSTTFSIKFDPITTGLKTAIVTVSNNDPDSSESTYTFTITGLGVQSFYDSDGDGVYDNVDIDDDNDGISDVLEETNCNNSNGKKVYYKFLNESFGAGGRTTINTSYNATTTYCYENGSGLGINTTECPTLSGYSLNDGEYTVGPSAQISTWAAQYWYTGTDHTGDTNGRMALFNASKESGIFYTASISGALPNIPINYSFWVLNLDRTDAPGIDARPRPNIKVEFRDFNDVVLATINTGNIAPSSATSNLATDWHQFTANINIPNSSFKVIFINNELGGTGNDLAIDDILITQPLCDFDGDGIPDVFDLDSDNDGIPDVVEAGLGVLSNGKGKIDMVQQWSDTNENGMYDRIEGYTPLNSDGDSQPNYIDLDSDNDSVFDIDESGAGNINAVTGFQNGDGDINGDGVGDGAETELFRIKDADGNGTMEYFGDGILDIFDKGNGNTFVLKYGNAGQGIANANNAITYLKDTDGDGIPDYLDITSNGSTFDIANNKLLYPTKNLDANNDGILDGNTDIDYDGILDIFDTNTSKLGSPRDINAKFYVNFDGRNDYAEGKQLLSSLKNSSMMGWIKLNSSYSNNGIVMGQDNCNLSVNASKQLVLYAAGQTITYTIALDENRWYHVAAAYDCTATPKLRLYLNGVENTSTTSGTAGSAFASSTAKFTIGKSATASSNYFNGFIDEVRVFNIGLSQTQIQKMMCQEIGANGALIRGTVIPKDIELSTWASLLAYYRMDIYKNDVIDDYTISGIDDSATDTNFTRIYNVKNINVQSAPMPYLTKTDNVAIDVSVNDSANFIKGSDMYTTSGTIVNVLHNVTSASNMTNVGLFVNAEKNIITSNDTKIENSWYLKLDGKIDLVGKSQLVQTDESDLDVTSAGSIERDQQGQANKYNYNYWSSPVSPINTTVNNTDYTVAGVMKDGTTSSPTNINWISGYDGFPTTPISLARYWLYTFDNLPNAYAYWTQILETSPLRVGLGYIMKGSGVEGATQNYTFVGKPNNGIITSNTVGDDQLLLTGNPYPSAIDADAFINDNITAVESFTSPSIDGTIYFWEHYTTNNTHILSDYQGGYAVRNLTGGIAPSSSGIDFISQLGTPSRGIPNRFIPVGQGFFVNGKIGSGGTIIFKNSQRGFHKEDDYTYSNVLYKTKNDKNKISSTNANDVEIEDSYKRIRLGFNSNQDYHRQVLLGFMNDKATNEMDYGYDGLNIDDFPSDMYFLNGDNQLVIQGVGSFDANASYPIGVKTDVEGIVSFTIDALENFDTQQQIYIYDSETKIYNEIQNKAFEVNMPIGVDNTRFSLRFKDNSSNSETLSVDENKLSNDIKVVYIQNENTLVITNNASNVSVEKVTLFNILGQSISNWKIENQEQITIEIPVKNISKGVYIAKLKTSKGEISKKIIF